MRYGQEPNQKVTYEEALARMGVPQTVVAEGVDAVRDWFFGRLKLKNSGPVYVEEVRGVGNLRQGQFYIPPSLSEQSQ